MWNYTVHVISISNSNVTDFTEPPQIVFTPTAMIEVYAEITVVTRCIGFSKDGIIPTIQWQYDGNVLTNSTESVVIYNSKIQSAENDLVFIESILALCDVGVNDTGDYSCTLSNSFRSAESSYTLNVKPTCKSCYSVCSYPFLSYH